MLGFLLSYSIFLSSSIASPLTLDMPGTLSMSSLLNDSIPELNSSLVVDSTTMLGAGIECFKIDLRKRPLVPTNFFDCTNANQKINVKHADTWPIHWHRNHGKSFPIPNCFTSNTCVIVSYDYFFAALSSLFVPLFIS